MKLAHLIDTIAALHTQSQAAAGRALQRLLSARNWTIGAWIVEYEQAGEDRAAYGDRLLHRLADGLQSAGVSGLSRRNLNNCRQVALAYPQFMPESLLQSPLLTVGPDGAPDGARDADAIWQTSAKLPGGSALLAAGPPGPSFPALRTRASAKPALSWRDEAWIAGLFHTLSFSHLLELSRIDDEIQRGFYEVHCLEEGWSIRDLKRQRGSLLFERTGLSIDKARLLELTRQQAQAPTPQTVLRDPYVLEFLELSPRARFTESDLEQALLDHLQSFLMELGGDFCFMARQFRISTGSGHHHLDLLFFHRGLRCLVAIDLKVEAFRHEHAGQMNFYVNYLADQVAREHENRPIGVILCTDKDAAEVHYATTGIEHSVFVSRYLAQLPSEEQLRRWLQEERLLLEGQAAENADG